MPNARLVALFMSPVAPARRPSRIIATMRLPFTKMHGAGNDFVVLDGTHSNIDLSAEQVRRLGDRRFGIGADQILVVERSSTPGVDFRYRIFNNTGDEVEHCGNGARCFVRFVRDKGLTTKDAVRVETVNNVLELRLQPDGRVTVDMYTPVFEHERIPFDASGLIAKRVGSFEQWPLDLGDYAVEVAVLSMGNPHAVQIVADIDTAPVESQGPAIEAHPRFPRHVNAGFMQIVNRAHVRLRVHERDAGETLACGTGACAAVVAGIRLGLLDARVDVDARGGRLSIEWAGGTNPVFMTGPAQTVFEGEIEL
jgi:diaminopimelate epimerase